MARILMPVLAAITPCALALTASCSRPSASGARLGATRARCSWMQAASDGSRALSVPRASPLALETLRDMARIGATVREMQAAVRPAAEFGLPVDQNQLTNAVLQEELADLNYRVAALQKVMNGSSWGGLLVGASAPGESLKTLQAQAQRLQRETVSQQQLLMILEEQESGSVERTQEVFDLMDINGDGFVSEEEFLSGATQLLNLRAEKNAALRAEVSGRFRSSAVDDAGAPAMMDFVRFCAFLRSLRGDALGPLRVGYEDALRQLLDVSLQVTALTLSRELVSADLAGDRAKELSEYVDTWSALQTRAAGSLAAGAPAAAVRAHLEEVTALAAALSLPSCGNDVGCTVESNARRAVRAATLALGKFRASLAFCGRGLQITGRDAWEVLLLLGAWWRGVKRLDAADRELMRRTVQDVLMLVPYTIIMVVPLTPPGHVFAFSVLNRCFPGAIPSGFTERRQGVYEIYSRIAADAERKFRTPFSPVRALRRASISAGRRVRKWGAVLTGALGTSAASANASATVPPAMMAISETA